jgi:hypothetical protein
MIARFPWVEGELGEDGNGLVHLEVAALRRGVEAAANDQDAEKALAILGFIDDLYRQPLELHPDVLNALDVSFVEDLYLSGPATRSFVAGLLGAATKARWDEVARSHR